MQLVEQHRIDRHDPRWLAIDEAAFASKNLYNATLYLVRQEFFASHYVATYAELDVILRTTPHYQALPRKVAQWVLKQVRTAWDSYFAALAAYHTMPAKFTGHPRLPQYLDTQKGRNLLVYTDQAISRDAKNAGWVVPSGVAIRVQTAHAHKEIAQVRLVPKSTHYVVEVVFEQISDPQPVDPALIASIDIGINNVAAITSNKPGFVPLLVNGRPLKSLNQSYNKRRAKAQATLPKGQFTSHALEALTDARHRAITSYLHTASRAIIDMLVKAGIGTLVIGKNDGWKQGVNLGKRTNQHFVFLPHARFIEMLTYKAALVGIVVATMEESHTSKCSFLDLEPLGHQTHYLGKRVKRGLFRAGTGIFLNADINASYNILRKYAPNAFAQGISTCVLRPIPLRLPDRHQDRSKQHVRRKASV